MYNLSRHDQTSKNKKHTCKTARVCDHIKLCGEWWRWISTLSFLCIFWANQCNWGNEGLKWRWCRSNTIQKTRLIIKIPLSHKAWSSVIMVSRFMQKSNVSHLAATKTILRYFKETLYYDVLFPTTDEGKECKLVRYTN